MSYLRGIIETSIPTNHYLMLMISDKLPSLEIVFILMKQTLYCKEMYDMPQY